jgi:hypothetical protein
MSPFQKLSAVEEIQTMPNNKNGHTFDFDTDVCTKCGMSREAYEDTGKPACKAFGDALKLSNNLPGCGAGLGLSPGED